MELIRTENIRKIYRMEEVEVHALRGVSLSIERGEFVAIMGASGSGKSTLMSILGCLDRPTEGKYFLDGIDVSTLSKQELADVRNRKIGFVFQVFNLLPKTTALENVMLPLLYDRTRMIKDPRKAALRALEVVSLGDRVFHFPGQLSGGQQQRVAIARALVNQPSIILADEPTGNLDSKTSFEIMALFQELNSQGITIVLVTHEQDIARFARRIVELRDGMVLRDRPIYKNPEGNLSPEEDFITSRTNPDEKNMGGLNNKRFSQGSEEKL
jgi:putative ABC transport system ATP-binding protein